MIGFNDFSLEITDYGFTGIDSKTKEKIGYSISHLEKLISLELHNDGITKETLNNGIKFKSLKILSLHVICEYSSDLREFEFMTKNCPAIENLKLHLFNFNDEIFHKLIKIIIKNLPVLEKVIIESWHNFRLLFIPKRNYLKFDQICSCRKCNKIKKLCKAAVKNEEKSIFNKSSCILL